MGNAGEKKGAAADVAFRNAEALLADAGEVTSKKMFGGFGFFERGVMFAMVTSKGEFRFRADETTAPHYEALGSTKMGKMPYYVVPASVLESESTFSEWTAAAIEVAHRHKK